MGDAQQAAWQCGDGCSAVAALWCCRPSGEEMGCGVRTLTSCACVVAGIVATSLYRLGSPVCVACGPCVQVDGRCLSTERRSSGSSGSGASDRVRLSLSFRQRSRVVWFPSEDMMSDAVAQVPPSKRCVVRSISRLVPAWVVTSGRSSSCSNTRLHHRAASVI